MTRKLYDDYLGEYVHQNIKLRARLRQIPIVLVFLGYLFLTIGLTLNIECIVNISLGFALSSLITVIMATWRI